LAQTAHAQRFTLNYRAFSTKGTAATKNAKSIICAIGATLTTMSAAQGQGPQPDDAVPVTVENFVRAETNLYFSSVALREGGFGKFEHHRELSPIDNQTIIRMNRDTLYSAAVFDLDAGPVTITLPDAGTRFMSLQAINEDEYSQTSYAPGKHAFTKNDVGTRYLLVGVRTLVSPFDAVDVETVHALQDAIKVEQPGGPGKFEIPKWDPASQKKVRDALIVLGTTLTDTSHAFGTKNEVDPVQRLSRQRPLGEATQGRTRSILISPRQRMTAIQSTSSTSATCQSMAFGLSASITPMATSKRTSTTLTRSTTSLRRKMMMVQSQFNSALATAKSLTAYRSWQDGITRYGSIVRTKKSWTANGNSPRHNLRCSKSPIRPSRHIAVLRALGC
jgi:uncharacterized protein DUF1254